MKIQEYLVMRTPPVRMGYEATPEKAADPGKVPTSRILLSILGLIAGIVASFYITGLEPPPKQQQLSAGTAQHESGGKQQAQAASQPPAPTVKKDIKVKPFSRKEFWTIGLISLAICGLTYQGLYFSLRLYQKEPSFLILFVAFQYGYFWQSAVKGASVVLAGK